MAIIKKSNVFDKGTIDLKQDNAPAMNAPAPQGTPSYYQQQDSYNDSQIPSEELESKAQDVLSLARSEAAGIVEQAQTEAQEIKKNSREEGLEEGRSQGQQQVDENIKEAMDTLNQAVKERKKIIRDAESEILRLSLKIAEQVIRSEVSLHKDVIMNMVAEAINRISDRENILIKVSREDAEQLKQNKEKIAGLVDGVKNLSIIEDSQIEAGGCIIETNLGYVDARISTKLALIEAQMKKVETSE